jgi:hypothetical protein
MIRPESVAANRLGGSIPRKSVGRPVGEGSTGLHFETISAALPSDDAFTLHDFHKVDEHASIGVAGGDRSSGPQQREHARLSDSAQRSSRAGLKGARL